MMEEQLRKVEKIKFKEPISSEASISEIIKKINEIIDKINKEE